MMESVPQTDENGAPLSKNALKRLQKMRLKAEKEAAKAPRANEGEIDPLRYQETRTAQMLKLREDKVLDPWPHTFEISMRLDDFVEKYSNDPRVSEKDSHLEEEVHHIGGRVMLKRKSGKNLIFYSLQGMLKTVQVVCVSGNWKAESDFTMINGYINRGDIIGVIGFPGRTKTGEFSLFATEVILLSPCLQQLPKGPAAFSDSELRFRKRFLDFIINERSRSIIITRHKVVKYMREYFYDHGFIEIETPIFNTVKGGATAKPFITHHNSLNRDLYLRIAPELYHKMLIVGGLERVFEIGKSFRNESIDLTHMPEFTSMECYCAFWDYNDQMKFCENMISSLVKDLTGSYVIHYVGKQDKDGVAHPVDIDFTPPWKRVPLIPAIEEAIGKKFPRPLDGEEALEFGKQVLKERGLLDQLPLPHTMNRIIDFLCGEYVEGKDPNPIMVIDHPRLMSPLTKYHRDDPELTERFEVHVAPFEIANAYTELNNPVVQRENFKRQEEEKKCDDEAMVTDETFCQSLEHALPPTGGLGIGIDRLVMLVANVNNIKEVITFPLNRDE